MQAHFSGCGDPWPSIQPSWCDPPWVLRGRAVTAWFDAPWDVLRMVMSPDLLPVQSPCVRTRLRFYDLSFEAVGPAPGQPLAPRTGVFREGALGFPAHHGQVDGECSAFLWTDSETYMLWAREAFGWPVRLASIELTGTLWSSEKPVGTAGSCSLTDVWGRAAITEACVKEQSLAQQRAGAPWFTGRRVLTCAGLDPERREMLSVRPEVLEPGTRYVGSAQVEFDFREPHPLHLLSGEKAEFELVDGLELLVARDVTQTLVCEEPAVTVSEHGSHR